MRLTKKQHQLIKAIVSRVVGPDSRVWLFGSRVDDAKRGGDIDLLVEIGRPVANRAGILCKLEGALVMALGNRKMDVLLKDGRTQDAPIFHAARQKGVLL